MRVVEGWWPPGAARELGQLHAGVGDLEAARAAPQISVRGWDEGGEGVSGVGTGQGDGGRVTVATLQESVSPQERALATGFSSLRMFLILVLNSDMKANCLLVHTRV